ncbi:hypothetical protein [Spirillospora sp. CA-294931]|uniref:hypothetical protein n=1 Tax=Spirillospora sp. CA-294931 TaxID=3240042 RepID=UPI003D8DA633
MISLKAAAIATSAVGAVAVSGVAWAATTGGTDRPAGDLRSGTSQVSTAADKAKTQVPAVKPTCLPKAPGAKLPDTSKLPKTPGTDKLPKAPGTDQLPKTPGTDKLPKAPGTDQLPKTPGTDKLPTLPGAQKLPNVPADLPTCLPKDLPGKPSVPSHPAPAPKLPGTPDAAKLDCSKVPQAVTIGGAVERAIVLPKGLKYVDGRTASKTIEARKYCVVTQKWAGKAGQSLTVERIKAQAGTTERQLRDALKIPGAPGTPAVGGAVDLRGPGGGGVLLFDQNGYSLYVNGSSVASHDLRSIAAALNQAAK